MRLLRHQRWLFSGHVPQLHLRRTGARESRYRCEKRPTCPSAPEQRLWACRGHDQQGIGWAIGHSYALASGYLNPETTSHFDGARGSIHVTALRSRHSPLEPPTFLSVEAVAMRNTDCDLRSLIVARADSALLSGADLRGKVLGVGALDSPQATMIPLHHLRRQGLVGGRDFAVRRFDVLSGKHGDHIGGERDAAVALLAGDVDACCMIDGNHLAFGLDGTLPAGSTRVIETTEPYDHCNFTISPGVPRADIARFTELLLGMRWDDQAVRPLMYLEGVRKWVPGRVVGYPQLESAVDELGFYGPDGAILDADYRY